MIDPRHHRVQPVLCMIGPLVIVLGVVLTVIGTMSYISSLRTFQPTSYLWGVMVGLPLISIGASFARFSLSSVGTRPGTHCNRPNIPLREPNSLEPFTGADLHRIFEVSGFRWFRGIRSWNTNRETPITYT